MSSIIPSLQCPWCPTAKRLQGIDGLAQHALAKHPEQLRLAGGLTPAAARTAAAARIVELYPHMWQTIPAVPVTEALTPGVSLSAPNCIPVTLDKLPYFPRATLAPTAAATPVAAATVTALSAPPVAVPAPTTPATPVNASITSNMANIVSGAMKLVSRAGAGAAAANSSPWGSLLHQQQLQRPVTISNNPPVTAKHLSPPVSCPAAVGTAATDVVRAAMDCLKAAAVQSQGFTPDPVTSAAALTHATQLTTAATAPTLSSLLQQALAHIPPSAAAGSAASTTAEMSDFLNQLASHLRSPAGPSAVTAAAAAVDASRSPKYITSPLAITGGGLPHRTATLAAAQASIPGLPCSPITPVAAGPAAGTAKLRSDTAVASARVQATLNASTAVPGPAGGAAARILDPNNLGLMAGLSQEVLQVLYNSLDHQSCRNVRLVNIYFAQRVLQHSIQQQGRLAVCIAALRRLLSAAEAVVSTARQSSIGLGVVPPAHTTRSAVESSTHAAPAAGPVELLLQAAAINDTSSVEAVVSNSAQQPSFAVNASVWEGSRTYDLADVCRDGASNRQHMRFLEDKLLHGVSISTEWTSRAKTCPPAGLCSDAPMHLEQQDVSNQLLKWLGSATGVGKSVGDSCSGARIMIYVYLLLGSPMAAGVTWEGLTSSHIGLLDFLEGVMPSHAGLSVEVTHADSQCGTAAAVRYGHAKLQGKGHLICSATG